jgi:integrase
MPKLTRRKDSPNVYAWITDPVTGRKKRVSTKERNKRTAQVIADGRERRAADPTYRTGTTTLEKAVHSFMTQHAARKAEGTRHMYDVKTRQLVRILGAQRILSDIDAQLVDSYTAKRMREKAAKSTIGKELTALRGVLKLARRHKLYPFALDEVLPDRWESASVPKERWCTAAEVWLIMGKLPPHRAAVVAFHVATGSNLGECMRAQPEDVDGERVFLRGTKRETRRRTAPVMPWGLPFLAYAVEHGGKVRGRAMFQDWTTAMRWDLTRVTDALKLAHVSSNDLRRTYGQWLRQAGVEPALIGITMGHADSRMVERVYGRVPVDKLRGLIDRQLSPPAAPPPEPPPKDKP